MDASIALVVPADAAGGQGEAALFEPVRECAEAMIAWARSGEALALEHDKLEEKTLADGMELMRRLTGDPAARAWVKDQAAKILAGKHHDVRAGIRRRATTYGCSASEREGADACADYLEHKQDYLDYPAFLAAGWPVASGLIEGAARWLIKDRMEVTGARWSPDSAEAVLKLRALAGNGDFDDYLAFHLKQEKQRNHDSRYQQPEPQAA
ncbi:MAG TPA: hypothetical protein VIY52_25515 [Streptosporangiaceae bacterium]